MYILEGIILVVGSVTTFFVWKNHVTNNKIRKALYHLFMFGGNVKAELPPMAFAKYADRHGVSKRFKDNVTTLRCDDAVVRVLPYGEYYSILVLA